MHPASEEAWEVKTGIGEAKKKNFEKSFGERKIFLPLQPATEVTAKGRRRDVAIGILDSGAVTGKQTERKKSFGKTKKKFAGSKKFPTFAVPNETGADGRSPEG